MFPNILEDLLCFNAQLGDQLQRLQERKRKKEKERNKNFGVRER
jgi:hypothetical protein